GPRNRRPHLVRPLGRLAGAPGLGPPVGGAPVDQAGGLPAHGVVEPRGVLVAAAVHRPPPSPADAAGGSRVGPPAKPRVLPRRSPPVAPARRRGRSHRAPWPSNA